MKTFLVIPTIREVSFLQDWQEQLEEVSILLIEDSHKKTIKIPPEVGREVLHFCWQDIKKDFGDSEWIIGRKNSGVRAYGFWKAYQMGADVVVTLDDDCYPCGDDLIAGHVQNLSSRSHEDGWMPTYPGKNWQYTRGFPYSLRQKRDVWLSHGLWSGALDLDGQTEVANGRLLAENPYPSVCQTIPRGSYYPMCSMNLAFVRQATPLMFFPMMGQNHKGESWGYDRFDDIWAGIFSKKILDYLNKAVVNGSPFVEHRKKSIPTHNLDKEKEGVVVNEELWKWVDAVELTQRTPAKCYLELAQKIAFPDEPYFNSLRQAMMIWARLFI